MIQELKCNYGSIQVAQYVRDCKKIAACNCNGQKCTGYLNEHSFSNFCEYNNACCNDKNTKFNIII